MNTEQTGIIILSSLIVIIYSIRLVIYLKNKRYERSKPEMVKHPYQNEKIADIACNSVYEPCREYDCSECVNKEWVMVKQQINLN